MEDKEVIKMRGLMMDIDELIGEVSDELLIYMMHAAEYELEERQKEYIRKLHINTPEETGHAD